MTYDDALAFWYGRINYEIRAAAPGDLKLERMRALLRLLGDPHERVRVVHITGTKGKGSTAAMLASVLQAAGFRVGLFTSPHLMDVRERIQVNRTPISREELAARVDEIAPAVRSLEEGSFPAPTFFEIGTALGFLHFWYRRCDIAIIEVGLGGRFDSTNVCRPVVSIITNVGLDHMAQLGDSLEAIAYQKGGIIKRGIPVVSGVVHHGARGVIRRHAAEQDAPLWELGQEFDANADPSLSAATIRTPWGFPSPGTTFPLSLLGRHQATNAALAVAAVDWLRRAGLSIPDTAISTGLGRTNWPARIERISDRPAVILDTAHNVPSCEALVVTLRESFPAARIRRVVFAVSGDKQHSEMLRILGGWFNRFYLTKYGNNPRCVAPERLAGILTTVAPGAEVSVHDSSAEAWSTARAATAPDDLLCVTGSVFLAGEVRALVHSRVDA